MLDFIQRKDVSYREKILRRFSYSTNKLCGYRRPIPAGWNGVLTAGLRAGVDTVKLLE